jgi:hypothetical protein
MRLGTTVRIIVSVVLLIILIIGFHLYTQHVFDSAAKRIETMILSLENNIILENWEEAQNVIENIEEDWTITKKTWAMFLDHTEIDNIDESLSKLKKYIETREPSLALAEASTLKLFIVHIPEKEALNFENIF